MMRLADTSVWDDHLRYGDAELATALDAGVVAIHPAIIGEIALGSLKGRSATLSLLMDLPRATTATDHEVLELIESRSLFARGIGWVDAHLIASTLLTPDFCLWTRDKRLGSVADELGLS